MGIFIVSDNNETYLTEMCVCVCVCVIQNTCYSQTCHFLKQLSFAKHKLIRYSLSSFKTLIKQTYQLLLFISSFKNTCYTNSLITLVCSFSSLLG